MLRRALSRPDAPKTTVWVDGMVRSNRKVLLRLIAPVQESELEKYSQDLQQKTGFALVAR